MWIEPCLIQKAKEVDLYDFLTRYHADDVCLEGSSCLLMADRHVSVKRGTRIFTDFRTGAHGDSIDYLQKYLGYSFSESIYALTSGEVKKGTHHNADKTNKIFIAPRQNNNMNRAIPYLIGVRGIAQDLIDNLVTNEYIYEDLKGNVVFLNHERNYYELRGTQGQKFCRNNDASPDNTNFFYFNKPYMEGRPTKCYICESAIDAMSLCELIGEDALYTSISGIANQQRIDKIKQLPLEPILAFDNDSPADKARERNADMKSIIPEGAKDWNELLQIKKGKSHEDTRL